MGFWSFFARSMAAGAALCMLSFGWGVQTYRQRPRAVPGEVQKAVTAIHAVLAGRPAPELDWETLFPERYPGPLVLSGYQNGQVLWRCEEPAAPLGLAMRNCLKRLQSQPPPPSLMWRMDLAISRAPYPMWPLAKPFMLVPGVEGLGVHLENGREMIFMPDDMYRMELLDQNVVLDFIPELRMGLDFQKIRNHVFNAAREKPRRYFRVAVWSILLDATSPEGFLPVFRGHPASVEVTRDAVLDAALAGGRYMVNALVRDARRKYPCVRCRRGFFTAERGQFLYNYHLVTGRYDWQTASDYNLVRHAGTAYALANLARLTQRGEFAEAAALAIEYMERLSKTACPSEPFLCVANDDEPDVGAAALGLLAVSELRLATGNPRFDEFAGGLARFLLFMQRSDGSFRHVYHVRTRRPDERDVQLFYSGEAALALAKAYRAFGDRVYLQAADRALSHLTGPAVSALPFHFGFGEEHWTCQAAREVAPEVMNRRYLDFCLDFARFIERQQFTKTDTAFPDYSGSYGFSPFIPPYTNGAGSRTEANVSILELARLHGVQAPHVLRQIRRSVEHILLHQKRASSCWLCADPQTADGAIVNSLSSWDVRIDTVQHTTTGLIRALGVLP